jgi:LacI family transcriptional regulator
MATIKDIARECGVSANTVSSVLNNKPGEVSAQTRERVLAAVRRLGYRPNAAARRMVGKRMNTIGIADRFIENTQPNAYKAQILEPLTHAARTLRWDVLYYAGHVTGGGFTAFLDGRSDGLISFTGWIDPIEVNAILASSTPVVFIGDTESDQAEHRASIIDVDNEAGAYLGVSHLTGLGHRRIGMLQGPGISGNRDRVAGFRRAMREAGVADNDAYPYPSTDWTLSGYYTAIEVLRLPRSERPTALFCFNDALALSVLHAAAELGISVPDELSVVGFDDLIPSALSSPPLTTVRQPLADIGRRAVEILVAIMDGDLPRDYREIVAPDLIVRSSTAAPAL